VRNPYDQRDPKKLARNCVSPFRLRTNCRRASNASSQRVLTEIFSSAKNGGHPSRVLGDTQWSHGAAAIDSVSNQALLDWCNTADPEQRFEFAASICRITPDERAIPIGETHTRWSDFIPDLLRSATNKASIVNILANRLVPMSWSGSRAQMIYDRIALLDELDVLGDDAAIAAVENAKTQLRDLADKVANKERLEEEDRNERFE
jgi:hypothetical protein